MQRSRCTELQANQKAVLQNLRMQFNRRCCTAGWVDGHLRRNWSCSKCLDEYWNELEQGRSDTAASAATIEAHNKLEAAAGAGPLACSSAGLWGHRATARGCSKKESCKNLRIGINRPRRKGKDTEEFLGRVIRNTSDLQHRVIIIIIVRSDFGARPGDRCGKVRGPSVPQGSAKIRSLGSA